MQEDDLGKERNTNVFDVERLMTRWPCKPTAGNSCCCFERKTDELSISFLRHGETKQLGYSDNLHPEG